MSSLFLISVQYGWTHLMSAHRWQDPLSIDAKKISLHHFRHSGNHSPISREPYFSDSLPWCSNSRSPSESGKKFLALWNIWWWFVGSFIGSFFFFSDRSFDSFVRWFVDGWALCFVGWLFRSFASFVGSFILSFGRSVGHSFVCSFSWFIVRSHDYSFLRLLVYWYSLLHPQSDFYKSFV